MRVPVVNYPSDLEKGLYEGKLYGYYYPESNEYNILTNFKESLNGSGYIGIITKSKKIQQSEINLVGYWADNQIIFNHLNIECVNRPYDILLNIYSRNTGILETDVMLNKSAIISGAGSVGSLVALELARAGVGKFLLIDNDVLSYHNICRHQLGIKDIGKFKVLALSDKIKEINPLAEVSTYVGIIEDIDKSVYDQFVTPNTIIIGCADNREADLYANHISAIYSIPFVSIGFWERAFAGEIFFAIPNQTPCYECLFGKSTNNLSARSSQNHRFYSNEEDLSLTRFEPGISVDINYITIIGVKIIIDLLTIEIEK